MNLNNLKTGKRLGLGFGILVILLLILSGIAWRQMSEINTNMDLALKEAVKMYKIKDINTSVHDIYLEMWKLVTAKDPAVKQRCKTEIENIRAEYKKALEELKASATTQTGKDLLVKLEDIIAGTRDFNNHISESALKAEGEKAELVDQFASEGVPHMADVIAGVQSIITWREKRIEEVDAAAESAYLRARWILSIGVLAAVILAGVFGALITRSIVLPLMDCLRFTGLLSQGDFSKDVSKVFLDRRDEMGDLARAFSTLVNNVRALLKITTEGIQTVASSATELSAVSEQTAQSVRTLSDKTATVAAAAEESSANTTSVAASMEQAATNLASVAGATEEMSATIGEIAANSEKAWAISTQAGKQAASVSSLMQQLGQAAREIGKVTETITDISSQTNLLALNATIEAARAGAAGKGFAVVANEIKELAKQTASATEDIKAKISGVQSSTISAIADIEKITGVISEVEHIVSSIATAIEEQATVTKDVAGNVAQASAGVQEANERVAQTASVSKSMARDIASVDAAAGEIRSGGEQVLASATELSQLGEQLMQSVGKFKVTEDPVLW